MNQKVISIDLPVNGKITNPINDYYVFYEIPFDKAFQENVPQNEWWKWGIIKAERLALTRQAPLLLMVLSEYNPDEAAELVETALRIATTCGRGSLLRNNAGLAIPLLKIPDTRKKELIRTAFLMTNMQQFEEYMKSPKSEAIKPSQGYYEYLSIETREFIHSPRESLIRSILRHPTLEASEVLKSIEIESLNLVGLFKLINMLFSKNINNASMVLFHKNVTLESLNSPQWFDEVSQGAGKPVTVSSIEPT